MVIGNESRYYGLIAMADEVRASSATAIEDLKRAGVRHTIMLTGDNGATAKAMAAPGRRP